VECIYAIDPAGFSAQPDSAGVPASQAMVILQAAQNDSIHFRETWIIRLDLPATSQNLSGRRVADVRRIGLLPGTYEMTLRVRDLNRQTQELQYKTTVTVAPLRPNLPALSGLQLCSAIRESADAGHAFYKNGNLVIPQMDKIFDEQTTTLYYYFEVYDFAKRIPGPFYALRVRVWDGLGEEVKSVPVRDRRKRRPGDSFMEAGAINIHHLPAGTYALRCALLDSSGITLAETEEKFFVYKTAASPQTQPVDDAKAEILASEFALMNEAALEQEFAPAAYLASNEEKLAFAQLAGIDAKRAFLFNFWRQRAGAEKSSFELRREYKKRVADATQMFSAMGRVGWKSDRGRVWILYGKPDEEVKFANSEEVRSAYRRWYYEHLEGGVEFIFVDRAGYGDFALVHSTKRGELRDDDWTRLVR